MGARPVSRGVAARDGAELAPQQRGEAARLGAGAGGDVALELGGGGRGAARGVAVARQAHKVRREAPQHLLAHQRRGVEVAPGHVPARVALDELGQAGLGV